MSSKDRPTILASLVLALLLSWACESQKPPSAYALVTMKHDQSRIQMVAIMEIPGTGACEAAFGEFLEAYAESGGTEGWRETERSCQEVLEPLYQPVMKRETFHATYLAFSPKETFDYEGRVVLYGIPSSQAQEICQQIASEVGKRLGVDAECVQGTVG